MSSTHLEDGQMTRFIYRDPDSPEEITKTVIFTGLAASNGRPQGRVQNSRGQSLSTRALTPAEAKAWEKALKDGQTEIEMGYFTPYESLDTQAKRLGPIAPPPSRRSGRPNLSHSAPSRRSGRGVQSVSADFALSLFKRYVQPSRFSGMCY